MQCDLEFEKYLTCKSEQAADDERKEGAVASTSEVYEMMVLIA